MRKLLFGQYLDLRSLALMRIFLGFCVMLDAINRFSDLGFFLTDSGMLPRATLIEEMLLPWSFSLHLISGHEFFIAALLALQIFLAVLFIMGWKTKMAHFLIWVLVCSLHDRNWFIINGGDDVLRCILFLSLFLPLHHRWSVDRALSRTVFKGDHQYYSLWTLLFIVQVGIIYFFSFLLKDHPWWNESYKAIYYALHLKLFTTPLGAWMGRQESLVVGMTIGVFYLEFLGPLLLWGSGLLFKFGQWLRLCIVLTFIAFHIGLILSFRLGLFPYICISMWIGLLPSFIWPKNKGLAQITVYYDGACGFCAKGVYLLREFLSLNVQVRPAQQQQKIMEVMEREHTWVVLKEGPTYTHFKAFQTLVNHRYGLEKIVNLSFVSTLGEKAYRFVAKRRGWFSKLTKPLSFNEKTFKRSLLLEPFALLVGASLIFWNLNTLPKVKFENELLTKTAQYLHLYQKWNMFSPFPKVENVWIETRGEFKDGKSVDLVTMGNPSVDQHQNIFIELNQTKHWRKIYLSMTENPDVARYWGDFLCRKHENLKRIQIFGYSQLNLENHQEGGLKKRELYAKVCGE